MSKFSENLKKLRLEKGYSQATLAEMIGVSQNAIYNWENGKREPRTDQREKLAQLFQIEEVTLMYGMTSDEYTEFQKQSRKNFAKIWNENRYNDSFANFLESNDIKYKLCKKDGKIGKLFSFNQKEEYKYFLTNEQARQLPEMSVEQIKTLIRSLDQLNRSTESK